MPLFVNVLGTVHDVDEVDEVGMLEKLHHGELLEELFAHRMSLSEYLKRHFFSFGAASKLNDRRGSGTERPNDPVAANMRSRSRFLFHREYI